MQWEPNKYRYIPLIPTVRQEAFLCLDCREAFIAGDIGEGKTTALLMAALMYVDVPGYNAILFRRTHEELISLGQFRPLAYEWLGPTDAVWESDNYRWLFPSGATLNFGYLDGPNDHLNYLSGVYQFIGIDQAVEVREKHILHLLSKLRCRIGTNTPLRFRCASNALACGQETRGDWVRDRYINPDTKKQDATYMSFRLEANPYIDLREYRTEKSVS